MFSPTEEIKALYKSIDLREQLTDEIKSKWYYKSRKHALRINKKSVIFDDDFKFKLEYHELQYSRREYKKHFPGEEVPSNEAFITLEFYIGEIKDDKAMRYYWNSEKYSDNINEALKDILVYIANYI